MNYVPIKNLAEVEYFIGLLPPKVIAAGHMIICWSNVPTVKPRALLSHHIYYVEVHAGLLILRHAASSTPPVVCPGGNHHNELNELISLLPPLWNVN